MPYRSNLVLGARISGGHFGDVYEGQDQLHGKVAVKVLKQNPGESTVDWANRSAELVEEAQHLKTAAHQNVVQVLNVVKDSGNDIVHLVAEFCDGGSVDAPYKNGPLAPDIVRKIITDACRGLEHIHSCGMVHRDIKPGNILKHGRNYKIGDFGLVSDNLLLGYASVAGYTAHLAPEVFPDPLTGAPGTTSAKSDVWALGMTVYRLLNGHAFYAQQFSGKNIAGMIASGDFSHRLQWLPSVPEAWRKFVRKAMHDDTGQRFQSARAMSQGLAILPVHPTWVCQYSPTCVKWEMQERGRTTTVNWTIHSPRKHDWIAIRSGGGKRNLTMGGTNGQKISSAAAKDQLDAFFSGWA